MSEPDRGPLIATFADGTKIYHNGIEYSTGYVGANVGIYNFSAEFDPNTGEWTTADTASFVTSVGPVSITLHPSDNGLGIEISGSLGIVDIGIIITDDGDVLPMFGFGIGNNIIGANIGVVIADDNTPLSLHNSITIQSDGTIIRTTFRDSPNIPISIDGIDYNTIAEISITDSDGIVRTFLSGVTPGDAAKMKSFPPSTFNATVECFLAGTLIDMWDGTKKRIEDITPKDIVLSYNGQGKHVPGNVTKTFEHQVKHILDVFGLQITPGHVTLCGDGKFDGRHVPIIDVLRDDGAMVRKDGSKVRASTGCDLGTPEDQLIHAVTGTLQKDGSVVIHDKGQIRLGTRYITDDGRDMSVADVIRHSGGTVTDAGLVKASEDGPELPFYWFFSAKLPKPEAYILQRSQVLLGDIYTANEWEGLRPLMPAPMQGEADMSYTGATPDMIAAMPPNIPLSMQGTGLEPKMSRKQRRAYAAKMRKGPYKSPVRVN